MKSVLSLHDPARHRWMKKTPMTIGGLLHPKHNSVASVINYIHMKQLIRWSGDFPEIKFPNQTIHFQVAGELYIFSNV